MLKTWRIVCFSLLLLLPAFLLGNSLEGFGWSPGIALAADRGVENEKRGCTNEHSGPSFGGTLVVSTDEFVCGDLTTFGGTIVIEGKVRGDIVAFGGQVVVAGTVDGNIDVYGSTVTLQNSCHIHGDLNLYGGGWIRGNKVELEGTVISHTGHLEWSFFSSGFKFPFWFIVIWIVLGILLTVLLPEHMMFVRATVVNKPRRSLFIGLLSMLLAPPVLVVLIAFIFTIPLAITVAIGLLAAWALGTVAIGWWVGDHVVRMVAPQHNTRPIQVAVGLTVLVLAGSLPYIGWLITIGAGLLGLGAVCLSRFGTRLYSQPKQPLPL